MLGWAGWRSPAGVFGTLLFARLWRAVHDRRALATISTGARSSPRPCSSASPSCRARSPRCGAAQPRHLRGHRALLAQARAMRPPRILLIVGGGIAAYKSCELVRLIRKGGGEVTCVLTEGGAQFVTPMALAALPRTQSTRRCGTSRTRSRWATSSCRARPTWWSSARRPPTCSPRWPPASPTIWRPRCCSPPTSRCWRCRR